MKQPSPYSPARRCSWWRAGAALVAACWALAPGDATATERYCAGTCHEDIQGVAHRHSAVEMGDCTDCHQPEASSSAKCDSGNVFAILPVPDLCFECHDDPANGTKLHGFDKTCNECHNPHGGDDRMNMQRGSVPAQCFSCHKEHMAGALIHKPVEDGLCGRCHDPHDSSAPKRLRKPIGELCFDCHEKAKVIEEISAAGTVHGPVAAAQCTSCHNPHQADNPRLLREGGNDLCFMCHGVDSTSDFAAQVRIELEGLEVHGAVAGGSCTDCHLVHTSQFDKLLTGDRPQLCYDCHDAFEDPIKHSAIRLGRCNGCHEAHASGLATLLKKEGADICFECHSDDVTGRPSVHKPVVEGRCLDCHFPHGGGRRQLLKQGDKTELCMSCHGPEGESTLTVDLSLKTVHGAITRHGCTRCHDAHGSNNRRMLIVEPNELCVKCHVKQSDGKHAFTGFDGKPHVVEGKEDPSRPGSEMSCSSCHDPHVSTSPKLWREGTTKMELCGRCHNKLRRGSGTRFEGPPTPEEHAEMERRKLGPDTVSTTSTPAEKGRTNARSSTGARGGKAPQPKRDARTTQSPERE